MPEMEEMVAPVSTCRREPFQGWWRPIDLIVSFIIFTVSVWNILVTPVCVYIYTVKPA
jgi:hypothetical protein